MQVGMSIRHDIDNDHADALRKIVGTFRDEGSTALNPVFVRGTQQFDSCHQGEAGTGGKHLNFDFVGENGIHDKFGRWRRPRWGGESRNRRVFERDPFFKRGDIHFDRAADMDVHVGVKLVREHAVVEVFDHGAGPEAMEAFPASAFA